MTHSFRFMTVTRTLLASAALTGALAAGGASAQGYTGPSSVPAGAQRGYTGPSSVAVTSVKTLIETGRDDQKAILRGRIVSHDGGDHYTFDDGTGRIRVDIDDHDFPAGVKIDDKTTVELHGELDLDRKGIEFDVDVIRVVQ